MDELLSEFLTETTESLDLLDVELVRFEQDTNNAEILNNIFRLVHTIKGTCGFLGLQRLAKLAHAAETLMGQYRDGAPVTEDGVSVILASIDRIKEILVELGRDGAEPSGSDADLIAKLEALAGQKGAPKPEAARAKEPDEPLVLAEGEERVLKPGEVSLEELERAFREAPGPADLTPAPKAAPPANDASAEDNGGGNSKEGAARVQTVRVGVDTLEHLMTTVSELVLTRNQLLEIVRRSGDSEFKTPLQRLSNVTAELQEGIMKARMQPIANAWQKLPRLVRELSRELGKKIELEMSGGDTELDRQVLEMIKDPLTHMIRNSADHGLETPAERVAAGKPETGKIRLRAYHQGGFIVIEVGDDGRGLNTQRIRAKAIENGLATAAELDKLSESEIQKFIFRPGFSTATAITGVSGRGVGMDVVRNNIELIGGYVELKSTSPEGTTFIIKIPLTLAIVSALIVDVCGQRFAIPQFSVVELVRASENSEHRVEFINDTAVLRLRDKLLPLLDMGQLLKLKEAGLTAQLERKGSLIVVVMQMGTRLFGVAVDSVFHTEEIVVKPMSSLLRDVSMFSGNTILGDGSVIMIVDANALAQAVGPLAAHLGGAAAFEEAARTAAEEGRTSLLLFRAGSPTIKAVPLSLITRLEEIEVASIERCNGTNLVQYRGVLMPLVYMDEGARERTEGVQPVLVFTEGGRPVGLAIDEVVDIVEDRMAIEIGTDKPGIIGAAIIHGKAAEVVDVSHYLLQALGERLAPVRPRATDGNRLLLIDDSQFFRNLLAPLLSASGYHVTVAASAQEALALKDSGAEFDIIISDVEMPEMDGIAFAERVRSDERWSKIPLVALSSHGSQRVIERTRAAGFKTFVGKFDRQGLMQTLKGCRSDWDMVA